MERHKNLRTAKDFLEIQGYIQIPGSPRNYHKRGNSQLKASTVFTGKRVFVIYNKAR